MRIKKTSQTTPIQAQVVNVVNNSQTDTYSCDFINKINGGVLLKSISGPTSVSITSSNGYGITTLFSTMYGAVVQFMGNNTTPNVITIYGTPDFTTSVSGKTVTLSGIHEWDHYIFLGSSVITDITQPSTRSVNTYSGDIEEKKDIVIDDGGEEPIDDENKK